MEPFSSCATFHSASPGFTTTLQKGTGHYCGGCSSAPFPSTLFGWLLWRSPVFWSGTAEENQLSWHTFLICEGSLSRRLVAGAQHSSRPGHGFRKTGCNVVPGVYAAAREIEKYRRFTNVRRMQIQTKVTTTAIPYFLVYRTDDVYGGTCSLGLIRRDKRPQIRRKRSARLHPGHWRVVLSSHTQFKL